MSLVDMNDQLQHAGRNAYAVCAFDIASMDFLAGAVAAAEHCRAPVILSISESLLEHGDGEMLAPAVEAAARHARVPVSIQCARARSALRAVQAIRLGCNGLAIEASRARASDAAPLRDMLTAAHACGVPVEAGLNVILRNSADAVSPEDARDFVERNGVDFFAIAETASGRLSPSVDFARLAQLHSDLRIPLTIDSAQAFAEDDYPLLIEGGVVKINHSAGLARAAAQCLRQNIELMQRNSYLTLIEEVRTAIRAHAEQCLRQSGSAGRADAAAGECRPWREIAHCIPFNVPEGTRESEVQDMLACGRKTLAVIPGVREVFTGRAVREGAQYRYCWLVSFAHSAVIDSYRNHPDHITFADKQFRPIAADRISIDFEEVS